MGLTSLSRGFRWHSHISTTGLALPKMVVSPQKKHQKSKPKNQDHLMPLGYTSDDQNPLYVLDDDNDDDDDNYD